MLKPIGSTIVFVASGFPLFYVLLWKVRRFWAQRIILKNQLMLLKKASGVSRLDDVISTSEKVVIIGAGGHGKVVADILKLTREPGTILGFIDDNPIIWGSQIAGLQVLGKISLIEQLSCQYPFLMTVVAIGDNTDRWRIVSEISQFKINYTKVIHPSAVIAVDSYVGEGTVVVAGAIINPGTVVGRHVIVNTASSIGHDCIIQDYAHISPGVRLGGGVLVGEGTQVGIGAVVIPCCKLGCRTLIGAGAAVVDDIPSEVLALGVPAKVKKENDR